MLNKTRTGALLVAQENTLLSINFCFYEETTPIKLKFDWKNLVIQFGLPNWLTKYIQILILTKKKGKEGGMCNKKHINL